MESSMKNVLSDLRNHSKLVQKYEQTAYYGRKEYAAVIADIKRLQKRYGKVRGSVISQYAATYASVHGVQLYQTLLSRLFRHGLVDKKFFVDRSYKVYASYVPKYLRVFLKKQGIKEINYL
jgi:hypothetical protein